MTQSRYAYAQGYRRSSCEHIPFGVGVASDIEPVPGPSLAVVRRGEQPIDDFLECSGRIVGDEIIQLLGSGRQADQVERRPANEGLLIGLRGRLKACGFKLREDEVIDRVCIQAAFFTAGSGDLTGSLNAQWLLAASEIGAFTASLAAFPIAANVARSSATVTTP